MLPHSALPPDARRRLAEIGPVWGADIEKHRDLVLEIYGPLLRAVPKDGVRVETGLAYGPHPRQIVDVFAPDGASGLPVFVFVHGGAFVRGSKDVRPEVYSNVLHWAARRGFVGVNVEYRLAPEAGYPAGGEDVRDAVNWVRAHIDRFGGDPEKIFLAGHSAGTTHVATYAYDPIVRPAGGPAVRGLVMLSGRYRADNRPENPNAHGVRAYFGIDETRYDAVSPVTHVSDHPVPMMIAIAEYENPLLDIYGAEFLHRVAQARGRAPRFVRLTRHNHISLVAHMNTEEEILGREIIDFTARVLEGSET